jgi:hypothetical protein
MEPSVREIVGLSADKDSIHTALRDERERMLVFYLVALRDGRERTLVFYLVKRSTTVSASTRHWPIDHPPTSRLTCRREGLPPSMPSRAVTAICP